MAERVADELRERILDGQLADGDLLPKQEDLYAEFGVARPQLREALRILETEGLLSVRRGKIGGSVVHRPDASGVAYMAGLVLRSRNVPVDDVAAALNDIEPLCAALCARRADRDQQVVPHLRAVHEAARKCIEDIDAFVVASRQFHEVLVDCCGNETLKLMVGALETVWSAHARAWAEQTIPQGLPDLDYRQQGLDDHGVLLRQIERGDADGAAREAAQHLAWAPVYAIDEAHRVTPHLLHSLLPSVRAAATIAD